jgi:hypothetical protein
MEGYWLNREDVGESHLVQDIVKCHISEHCTKDSDFRDHLIVTFSRTVFHRVSWASASWKHACNP